MLQKKIHYAVVCSFLFPIPIPLFAIVCAVSYGIIQKYIQPKQWAKQQLIPHYFMLLSLITSLLARNIVGICVTLSIYTLSLYFSWFKRVITPHFFQLCLTILLFGSWIHALYAFLQMHHILPSIDYSLIHPSMMSWNSERADSVFFNPNYYALICIFIILIALYRLFISKQRLFLISTIIINFYGIILSQSRAAMPALMIGVSIFIWCLIPKRYRKLFWRSVFIICMIGIPLLHLLPRFDIQKNINDLVDIRFQIWEVSWQHFFKTSLIGSGPLTYMSIYSMYQSYKTEHAHNLFLDSLLNYGVIGSLLLLYVFSYLTTRIHVLQNRPLRALAFSFLGVVLAHGMLDVSILWVHTLFIFLIVISFCFTQPTKSL